ncbi:interleukin-2 receptor subunit alpha [Thomomys bottae]
MEPSLLMWGLCTALVVPGCLTELCDSDPPHVRHAAFKAFAYKKGTMLNCDCKEGFRRIKYGSSYITCAENSSWDNRCQCVNTSNNVPRQQSTPQPEERKDRKTTEMQGPMQPLDEMNLKGKRGIDKTALEPFPGATLPLRLTLRILFPIPDHCREPPFWEHEGQRRIYHFVVGQVVHYQCMQGYRALQRSPATSTCRMICGKTRWSQPRLTCVNEDEPSPFPGEEDPQASTDELPETETPCLSPTTGTWPQQPHALKQAWHKGPPRWRWRPAGRE